MAESADGGAAPRLRLLLYDAEVRASALITYERATDLALILLAAAMVPLLILPLVLDLRPVVDTAFFAADWTIWAVFAGDLVVRTYLSERRVRYLTTHWYDVLIVAIPFLRPLRILRSARLFRLLRLSRLVAFGSHALAAVREIGKRNGLAIVLALSVVLLFAAAALVFAFERGADSRIDSFGTALWWAVVTMTTVGYGDATPVTPEGRGVAVLLMVVGISLFGFLTANIAAFLVEQGSTTTLDDVMAKLDSLERDIASMRGALQAAPADGREAPAAETSPLRPEPVEGPPS